MSDLPSTSSYVQVEDTAFRRSTDTQVYSQIGSDVNFLLDNTATSQANLATNLTPLNQARLVDITVNADGLGNFAGLIYQADPGISILQGIIGAQYAPDFQISPAPQLIFRNVAYSLNFRSSNGNPVTGVAQGVISAYISNGPTYDQVYLNMSGLPGGNAISIRLWVVLTT